MPITFLEAQDAVTHALGGDPVGNTAGGIANEAGRELMNAAGWLWAESVPGTADFVEDEDSCALPSAFLRFSSTPRLSGGTQSRLELVSVNRLETLRTGTDGGGDPYWGAVLHEIDGDGLMLPRLSLYPTPNADAAPGLLFTYTSGWTDLADDADIAAIPTFMEPLYREFLRACARGYEDDLEHPGRKQQYLDLLLRGPTMQKARETDRSFQQSFGPVRGGVGHYSAGGHTLVTWA